MLASIFSRHFEVSSSTAEIIEADPSRSPSAAAKEPFRSGQLSAGISWGFCRVLHQFAPDPSATSHCPAPCTWKPPGHSLCIRPQRPGRSPRSGGFREPGCTATHCPPHLHGHSPAGSQARSACASLCLSKELEALIKLQQKGNVCSFSPLCQENKGFVLANLWKQPQLPAAFTDCSKGKGK